MLKNFNSNDYTSIAEMNKAIEGHKAQGFEVVLNQKHGTQINVVLHKNI